MAKKRPHLGEGFRKVQPRLRMVANGSESVNAVRADFDPALKISRSLIEKEGPPPNQNIQALALSAPATRVEAKKGKLKALADDVKVSVFVERRTLDDEMADRHGKVAGSTPSRTRGRMAMVEVPISELPSLADDPTVERIEMGEPLRHPRPALGETARRAPSRSERKFGNGGDQVLVGIIDVGGFDFAHPDFLDGEGHTRFVSIWDQGGEDRPPPAGFDFGAEILKPHMDAAIDASASQGLAPQLLEPQSAMEMASHGTHVASIAAGNRGICRNAFLTGVLIDLPLAHLDRRASFYDSTRIAHAVEYILAVGERLRAELGLDTLPISINISLGTNGHAHDGSSAISRWIEHLLSTPGRAVSVAAGNAGQEAPESEGDIGFVMGRIHTSGRIAARGLVKDIDLLVVGNGMIDVSENELEVWYAPSDRFAVSVKPPGGDWIGPVEPGQFIENRQLPDKSFVSVYNELYHPANGANYIGVYLTPFLSSQRIVGISPGLWRVRLTGLEVRDGHYHGWIERDDPMELGPVGQASAWRFPSFFAGDSNVDDTSVSSLGCGEQVLCVANYDRAAERINISSSQGPTRDNRLKPDIAAHGTDVVAACGFSFDQAQTWIPMTGTSMASPFVCGVAGLMLSENPRLTASQIRGILQRTGQPLPGNDFAWRNDAGYGVIDPLACLAEVKRLSEVEDLT